MHGLFGRKPNINRSDYFFDLTTKVFYFLFQLQDTIDIGTVINGSSLLRMVISKLLTGATMFWGQDAVDNLCDVTRAVVCFYGPIFKQYDDGKMGYRANIVFGNSNGADFSYQRHLGVIKKDSLHPVYLF